MNRSHSPDTARSSHRLQRTPAPPLSRATLRGYSLMRWITLGASTGAPLLGLKHPLHADGIAVLLAGVVGYVLLVNYHFGRSRCDQTLPPRLPPGVYTALSVALIFALMVLPAEATNGQSLWFCVMFFVVIGETRHLRSERAVIATVAASGVAIGLAVGVVVSYPRTIASQHGWKCCRCWPAWRRRRTGTIASNSKSESMPHASPC